MPRNVGGRKTQVELQAQRQSRETTCDRSERVRGPQLGKELWGSLDEHGAGSIPPVPCAHVRDRMSLIGGHSDVRVRGPRPGKESRRRYHEVSRRAWV